MAAKRTHRSHKTAKAPHKAVKASLASARLKTAAKKKGGGARSKAARRVLKRAGRGTSARRATAKKIDVSVLPSEAISKLERSICLACVLHVFTRHMGLALKTAHQEIKHYRPSLAELNRAEVTRPYFNPPSAEDACPYCGSPPKWHARLTIHRIEGGRTTDALRRQLVKVLPTSGDRYIILEEKATRQGAFFAWLERISEGLDLDDQNWLREVSLHYLARKEPKEDWPAQFEHVWSIRRSSRLESGWEVDNGRLFLAPALFDELLLVQYLVSRSHKAGGLTLEGRRTLPEMIARLRHGGYLRAVGVQAPDPSEAFEQLLAHLSGGDAAMKFHYIVDRRDFLQKVQQVKAAKPPRPKPVPALPERGVAPAAASPGIQARPQARPRSAINSLYR